MKRRRLDFKGGDQPAPCVRTPPSIANANPLVLRHVTHPWRKAGHATVLTRCHHATATAEHESTHGNVCVRACLTQRRRRGIPLCQADTSKCAHAHSVSGCISRTAFAQRANRPVAPDVLASFAGMAILGPWLRHLSFCGLPGDVVLSLVGS